MQNRPVAIWLAIICLLVFGMTVLGGLTRLTGSGLSMVNWEPVKGNIPPLTQEAWEEEFEAYKKTPEYINLNSHMDLNGYKKIFIIEFLHRRLGVVIFWAFLLPLLYFAFKKKIKGGNLKSLFAILGVIVFQGFVGIWMVKSGLTSEDDYPRVSHLRLSVHLGIAMVIFALVLNKYFEASGFIRDKLQKKSRWALALVLLVYMQIISGGLVAGNRAGNAFMAMLDPGLPRAIWIGDLGLLNIIDNIVTILALHIALAMIVAIVGIGVGIRSLKVSQLGGIALALMFTIVVQWVLGLKTGMYYRGVSPVLLGSLHQGTALILFALSIALYWKSSLLVPSKPNGK